MNQENKVCSNCGSIYSISYTKTIMRDKDFIDCDVCDMHLLSWDGAVIYSAKLIEKHEKHLKE